MVLLLPDPSQPGPSQSRSHHWLTPTATATALDQVARILIPSKRPHEICYKGQSTESEEEVVDYSKSGANWSANSGSPDVRGHVRDRGQRTVNRYYFYSALAEAVFCLSVILSVNTSLTDQCGSHRQRISKLFKMPIVQQPLEPDIIFLA